MAKVIIHKYVLLVKEFKVFNLEFESCFLRLFWNNGFDEGLIKKMFITIKPELWFSKIYENFYRHIQH